MELAIYLVFGVLFVMLFVTFGLYNFIWFKKEVTDIEIKRTRFTPDKLGNYPTYFDAKSGISYDVQPGNKAYPDQIVFIGPGQKGSNPATNRYIKINDQQWSVTEVPAPVPTQIEERSVQNDSSENVLPPEKYQALLDAKRARKPKADSIKAITGFSKGGSIYYQNISQIWDELQ